MSVAGGSTAVVAAVAGGIAVAVGSLVQAMVRPATTTANIANQD
jgi:hypothetical protein